MTQDVSGAPALVPVLLNESFPTYASGRCPKCAGFVLAQPGITITWDSNEVLECPTDAAKFSRLTYIKEALARLDTIAFALFASDRWIGAQADLTPGEVISYSLPTEGVKKWVYNETQRTSGHTPSMPWPQMLFIDTATSPLAMLWLQPSAGSELGDNHEEKVAATWYRFGLSELDAVPAWRQTLFLAARNATTTPAASIVLTATAFEAFFIESMSIFWREAGNPTSAFKAVTQNRPSVPNLVRWMPELLLKRRFEEAPENLFGRWERDINGLRNRVVHEGHVQVTSEEATESLRTALDCITFFDDLALVKPHSYYRARR